MSTQSVTTSSSRILKRKGSSFSDAGTESQASSSPVSDRGERPLKKSKSTATVIDDEDGSVQGGSTVLKYNNKTIPDVIEIPPVTPGTIKICSWNVAGYRACQNKGFKRYVEAEVPDILLLTETKMNDVPVDPFIDNLYPHRYWNIAKQKGYGESRRRIPHFGLPPAGTAIFSKIKPLNVSYVLPDIATPDLVKGRLVILEFETLYLVGTYVVNAGQNLKTMNSKVEWQRAFTAHIRHLDSQKPVIWAGDLNVAPTAKDLSRPKTNWNKSAGYTAIETEAFAEILNPKPSEAEDGEEADDTPTPGKFIDVWRKMNPEEQDFTYYSMMRKCREKGIGWRLDMFVVSERIYSRIKTCEIRGEIYGGSDHVPIVAEVEAPL
ncbi:hypothetical protein FS837_005176 [Tulasnella sp. UAMH 9824]|nr:hypothetical protein FS837_005176 [Tulasnella sp. UAMH 9824]